jgi:tetratricopeptide (TPR) repeat protein
LDASVKVLQSALRVAPDNLEALFALGIVFAGLGDLEKSLRSYKQVLRLDPRNVGALAQASNLCLEAGLLDQCETYTRQILALQPNNSNAHYNLSGALFRQGRGSEALGSIERALSLEPKNLDYVLGKAYLLRELKHVSHAIEWFKCALELNQDPRVALELASLLMHESCVEEAVDILESASPKVAPESRPYLLLGTAYTESGRFDEAAKQWELAKRYPHDERVLLCAHAQSEMVAGRMDVAENLLREGLQQFPRAAELYRMLTSLVEIGERDQGLVEAMEALSVRDDLSLRGKTDLNYALGKAYHDLTIYERAIKFYDEANRLAYESSSALRDFNPRVVIDATEHQIAFFTKEKVEALRASGSESADVIFIVGMIRSGTTLAEQILSSHSCVREGGERTFWQDYSYQVTEPRVGRFEPETGAKLKKQYLSLVGLSEVNGANQVRTYFVDKNPGNIMVTAMLHCLFPNAKFIHMKRHPVDNLLSIWMTPITTTLPFVHHREHLVLGYREYRRLARHLEEVLPTYSFHNFQYEKLTSHPRETVPQMLEFLGLEVEEACFSPESNQRSVRTPSVAQVRRGINEDSQARWKKYEPWLGAFADLLD